MYTPHLHRQINEQLQHAGIDIGGGDNLFYVRFLTNVSALSDLFAGIYGGRSDKEYFFSRLINGIIQAYLDRPALLRQLDARKEKNGSWHLSNELAGMSLDVERFCGRLESLEARLDYFGQLGVNLLHLTALMKSPSASGTDRYAISDFREIDSRIGTIQGLEKLREGMNSRGMYLMLDFGLNHTSNQHEWAVKAKSGDTNYQEYYFMYADRQMPDRFDAGLQTAPSGHFIFDEASQHWVLSLFQHDRWDLNYANPAVLLEMLDHLFFYANIGVDLMRLDHAEFVWKRPGTGCRQLPEVHVLLCLIKTAIQIAAPGMVLMTDAAGPTDEGIRFFGTGLFAGRECDFVYHAGNMSLQWDALATGDTRIMQAAQTRFPEKPSGTSWIQFTRNQDAIGFHFEDELIAQAGINPSDHRRFLRNHYAGIAPGSLSKGTVFSVDIKTQDFRISGSLASFCGLEKALEEKEADEIDRAIQKILLMQAYCFFQGGMPMLHYGDESGYTNDYDYLRDPEKSHDCRWMHRPLIDWERQKKVSTKGTIEYRIFQGTHRLLELRRKIPAVADLNNRRWMDCQNSQVAAYFRSGEPNSLCCFFNFSQEHAVVNWSVMGQVLEQQPGRCFEHYSGKEFSVEALNGKLPLESHQFLLLDTAH